MTKIDQFESVFRSADKPVFHHEPVSVRSVLVVTDKDAPGAKDFTAQARQFLRVLDDGGEGTVQWRDCAGDAFADTEKLLALVDEAAPDLICTYRCMHSQAWKFPHSLGVYLDVLAQATAVPILVLPHPDAGHDFDGASAKTREVMAITDHLAGDHRLVNYAVHFTAPGGTLYLTHIEDEANFERMIAAIAKIESIDTDDARQSLARQLTKEPRDYIRSCREALANAELPIQVEEIVAFGQGLAPYKQAIEKHEIDLLVMNTKDEDQLAMHGLAYPLAVELRAVPILML